ncbi:hypothetical protein [Citrobacter phage vB_CfrS_K1M]
MQKSNNRLAWYLLSASAIVTCALIYMLFKWML